MGAVQIATLSIALKAETQQAQAGLKSFESEASATGARVNASLTSVQQTVTSMAAVISSSSSSAASSLGVIGAQADALQQQLAAPALSAQQLGALVESSALQGAAGLQSLGGSAQQIASVVDALKGRINENASTIARWSVDIAAARQELATLAAKIQSTSATSPGLKALKDQYAQLAVAIRGMATEQGVFAAENRNLNQALGVAQGSLKSTNAATLAAEEAARKAGQATGFWSTIMATHTSQISTQGTMLAGYDSSVQAVARSLGGVPVAAALAFSVIGSLAGNFLKSSDAGEKVNSISKELIETEFALANAFRQMSEGAGESNERLGLQAERLQNFARVDIAGLVSSFSTHFDDWTTSMKAAEAAEAQINLTQHQFDLALQSSGENIAEVAQEIAIQEAALKSLRQGQEAESAARDVHNQTLTKTAEVLVSLTRQGLITEQQVLAMGRTTLGASRAFDEFQARILDATSALAAYNRQVAAFRIPNLNIQATSEGLESARGQINRTITDLATGNKSFADSLVATKPAVEQYVKSVKEKVAADAAAAGRTLTHAQAQSEFKKVIQGAPDNVQQYAKALQIADKNLSAFSESHKKAGGAARSSAAALNEFKVGAEGFGDAVRRIESSGANLEKLFQPIPKAARAAAKETLDALKVVADGIEEFLKSKGLKIKVTPESLASLDTNLRRPLESATTAMRIAQQEIERIQLQDVASRKNYVEINAVLWKRFSQSAKDEIKKTGDTIRLVIPEIDQDFAIYNASLKAAELSTKSMTELTGAYINDWAKGLKDSLGTVQDFGIFKFELPKPINREDFALGKEMKEAVTKLRNDIQNILGDGVGGVLVDLADRFKWHLDKVRSWASDIDLVIGSMPGKFGEMARGVYSSLDQWLKFANGVLSILNRLNSDIPSSVGGMVSKIVGIFKNAGGGASGGGLLGSLLGGAGGLIGKLFGGGASSAVGAAASAGKAALGGATAAAGGAAGGSSWLAALGGPWGIAAAAGIAAIPLIGKLFHHKSAAEKEAEANQREQARLQLEQVRLSVQETRQNLVQGAIDIGKSFTEFADSLSDYSRIPKDAFNAFRADLLKYAEDFGEIAAAIGPEVAKNIKELGEALQPALESGVNFIELADGLNRYTGIAKSSIRRAGADLQVLITELSEVYENLTKQQIKLARKLGEKTKEPIQLVKDYLDATLNFGNIRVLAAEGMANLKAGIDAIVAGISDIASKTDLGLTKQGARFAERAIVFTNLIKSAREALSGDFVLSGSSIAESLDILYRGILLAAEKTGLISKAIGEDALLETASAAEQLGKVVSIWKDASEGFKAIVGIKDDPSTALDLLYAGVLTATEKTVLIAKTIGQELLNEAKDAAVAIKEVVSVLKDSGEGFKSLVDFYSSTKDFDFEVGANRLQGGIFILLDKLISLSRAVPQSMLAEAAAFASGMKPVFEAFNVVFASFKELVTGQTTIRDAMVALQSALEDAITRARGLTGTAAGFVNQSAQFKNLMREAADNFKQGLSLQGGSGAPSQIVAGGSGSPQTILRSGSTSTVINQYNIPAGAFVVDVTKFANVQEFMAEMQRRYSSAGGGVLQAGQAL